MVQIMVENDKIKVKCKGGGSIVDKTTLFSPDGQFLYVPWNNILRCYSVETGEKIADYEGCNDDIISVKIHPLNSKLVIACSRNGEVAVWQSGILILKHKIQTDKVLTFHLVAQEEEDETCLIILSYLLSSKYYVSIFSMNDYKLKTHLPFNEELIALDVGGTGCNQFLAGIRKKRLFYMQLLNGRKKVVKCKLGDGSTFTCLACHPQENGVATGDSMGRVIIWREFLGKSVPVRTVYHWHTLPVNVVAFSHFGSVLYSGGDECVLVKWKLDDMYKDYLPRMPASIVHLSSAPDNVFMAISLRNNGIHIIDAKFRVKQVIQHLTWSVTPSAGLKFDSRTKSLVFNGNVGNLQFYSPHTMSLLYNLDVVDQNKLTGERKLNLPNTNVNKIALTKLGDWLACVEERQDSHTYPEVRLKFFHFDTITQIFILNTSVEFPHENGVNGLEFQPTCSFTDILCATIGNDKQFKIWSLVDTTDIYRKSRAWRCLSTGYYKNLPANAISFSTDGSLIAVAFGPCLTAWSPDTCDLKCSLVHPNFNKSPLRSIQFGNVDQCHLVVTMSSERLSVWNLLTLALVWTVPVRLTQLCVDPLSTYMAAFTKNSLFIFTPGSATPVYRKKLAANTDQITGASFVPHKTDRTDGLSWERMSQLYFINAKQDLLCLESDNQQSSNIAMEYSATPERSTFDAFLAEARTTSEKDDTKLNGHLQTGLVRATQINELLEPPIHTMAPMRFLCSSMLRSLVMKKIGHKDTTTEDDVEESDEEFGHTDSDSETEKKTRKTPNIKSKTVRSPAKANKASLKAVMAEPLNWTFGLLD